MFLWDFIAMPRLVSEDKKQKEGLQLKQLRESLGYSKTQLANEWNVSLGAISQWESGQRSIPGPVLKLMQLYAKQNEKIIQQVSSTPNSRIKPISKTAVKLAAGYTKEKFSNLIKLNKNAETMHSASEIAIYRELFESMRDSKALLMKFGQILSYTNIFLPSTIRAIFRELVYSSTPLDFGVVNTIITEELNLPPSRIFSQFYSKPLSSASIGQVHAAKTREGLEVVVKVQYPDIEKAMACDIKNSRFVENLVCMVFRGQEKNLVANEMERLLLNELNYKMEADNLILFNEIFSPYSEILIPRPHLKYCTKRVLTMDKMNGLSFDTFIDNASPSQKNAAAEIIFRFNLHSIFNNYIFNCDPHPGNYLFQEESVVFLDFGSVKKFTKEFIDLWRTQLKSMLDNDRTAFKRSTLEMGFVYNKEKFNFDYHFKMMKILFLPVTAEQPFAITRNYIKQTWDAVVTHNPNKYMANVPADWLSLNRLQWGLYAIIADLGAALPFRKLYEEFCL